MKDYEGLCSLKACVHLLYLSDNIYARPTFQSTRQNTIGLNKCIVITKIGTWYNIWLNKSLPAGLSFR